MNTKTTMVVIFQLTKFSFIDLSLPTEEVFHVNGQNRQVANLPVIDFLSAGRNANTKATEYVPSSFSPSIFVYSSSRKV